MFQQASLLREVDNFYGGRTLKIWDITGIFAEAVAQRCSVRKGVLKNFAKFAGKHLCLSLVSFLMKLQAGACNFIKKRTPSQVFSCEFCEISKNTFPYRIPLADASVSAYLSIFLFGKILRCTFVLRISRMLLLIFCFASVLVCYKIKCPSYIFIECFYCHGIWLAVICLKSVKTINMKT